MQPIDFASIIAKLQAWIAGLGSPAEVVIGIRGKVITFLTIDAKACPVIIGLYPHAGLINERCTVTSDEHLNMLWSP